ncbi:hypothetical protein SMACR_02236 [Sordaria macrospora]|uniref:WGS project CABT00000000 data, contig 2.23 n=2 Tax=Sordaria macrospora TaxID=5147 RepID=F7W312_SORMK|nr:uncharacterized protein SMAC_02236 [Sordaria macrospora k-hell]KAA8627989.1 hypothetical protein SMACR_02236 [Sordaria macrospora]KAH7629051.1 hypothetical protein B0T09DRAFT_409709 [Sordaria sp. MPI-SDFR-AT-0083]WPJ63665.1 hypothetical protein SMAC4_02236 [Sordaria macrospora]CCC12014.1 unnamed protein product [Sordaria macrospora k-hell]
MRFTVSNVLVAAGIVVISAITGRVSAHPTDDDKLIQSIAARHVLEGRFGNTKSQCKYWSDPRNCIDNICLCEDGNIYALNRENIKHNLHGCDPPKDRYPMGPCQLKVACCDVPTYHGNQDDNPVLT